MVGGGAAALLLGALFFLSAARPAACSCPPISRFSCKGDGAVDFGGPRPCGDNRFRCRDSRVEIQFGGGGQWYGVVNGASPDDNQFEIEDPTLSRLFTDTTECDFLYRFPQPAGAPLLLFAPPQTLPSSLTDLRFSDCSGVSDYELLFSNLIERYLQPPPCTAYDLYYRPTDLLELQPRARNACEAGPRPAKPTVIWRLSADNTSDGAFGAASVGLSRRHAPSRVCFERNLILYFCGKGHRKKRRNLIIGLCTAAAAAGGASTLACLLLYLWRRNKKMKAPSSSTLLSHGPSPEPSSGKDPEELMSINYPTHVFRYQELHEATNGFSPSNELDEGGHGAVYRGTLPDGRAVAVKRLFESSCKRAELFMNEVAILSGLRHPNLVALYGCTSRHSRELLLVYEFIPNGTIADHLHGHRAAEGALIWPLRLRIAVETATALAHLHAMKPQIIHRDVKTSNILLDGDFHVKVGDFGLSRLFPVAATHVSTVPQGTPGYVDPEYHRCYQLTDKSDVYSFGVVLVELISSKPAVDISRHHHEINLSDMALRKIQNDALQELVDPKLGFETDWEVRRTIELVAELATRCLLGEKDPRPTMEGVLEVLLGIADGLRKVEKGEEADHMVGDGIGLQKNRAPASPDSVIGKWSSRTSTPNASG